MASFAVFGQRMSGAAPVEATVVRPVLRTAASPSGPPRQVLNGQHRSPSASAAQVLSPSGPRTSLTPAKCYPPRNEDPTPSRSRLIRQGSRERVGLGTPAATSNPVFQPSHEPLSCVQLARYPETTASTASSAAASGLPRSCEPSRASPAIGSQATVVTVSAPTTVVAVSSPMTTSHIARTEPAGIASPVMATRLPLRQSSQPRLLHGSMEVPIGSRSHVSQQLNTSFETPGSAETSQASLVEAATQVLRQASYSVGNRIMRQKSDPRRPGVDEGAESRDQAVQPGIDEIIGLEERLQKLESIQEKLAQTTASAIQHHQAILDIAEQRWAQKVQSLEESSMQEQRSHKLEDLEKLMEQNQIKQDSTSADVQVLKAMLTSNGDIIEQIISKLERTVEREALVMGCNSAEHAEEPRTSTPELVSKIVSDRLGSAEELGELIKVSHGLAMELKRLRQQRNRDFEDTITRLEECERLLRAVSRQQPWHPQRRSLSSDALELAKARTSSSSLSRRPQRSSSNSKSDHRSVSPERTRDAESFKSIEDILVMIHDMQLKDPRLINVTESPAQGKAHSPEKLEKKFDEAAAKREDIGDVIRLLRARLNSLASSDSRNSILNSDAGRSGAAKELPDCRERPRRQANKSPESRRR